MAMDALHRLCLLVCVLIGAGCSQSPRHQRLPATTTTTAGNGKAYVLYMSLPRFLVISFASWMFFLP